jgi:hypothetical protein
MDEICFEIAKERNRVVERMLITMLEEIEGRVPTNEEVTRFALRKIFPDGTQTYFWKGKKLFNVEPLKFSY